MLGFFEETGFLILAVILILVSAEVFINAVEWLGKRLQIAETAVGTVFAAAGTALPETLVTLIAVAFGTSAASKDIGMGAIIGGPLMLATVAYAVVGITMIVAHREGNWNTVANVMPKTVLPDMRFFIIVFGTALLMALVPNHTIRVIVACLILASYFIYIYFELKSDEEGGHHGLKDLYLHRDTENPHYWRIIVQTVASAAGMVYGAHLFVYHLEVASEAFGMAPLIISLLISPFATELPELFTVMIWTRNKKEHLAIANISGAMLIQASIPCFLGLVFTEWKFTLYPLAGALAALTSISSLYWLLKTKHLTAGMLSLAFIPYLVFIGIVLFA